MARVPTLEEEDAKRPNRERENLVSQRTRIVNRMKSPWPASPFRVSSQPCAKRLARLLTPEGALLPPNTLTELQRDMARLRFIMDQIREIEAARLVRLEQHPEQGSHAMVRLLAQVIGIGIETWAFSPRA